MARRSRFGPNRWALAVALALGAGCALLPAPTPPPAAPPPHFLENPPPSPDLIGRLAFREAIAEDTFVDRPLPVD